VQLELPRYGGGQDCHVCSPRHSEFEHLVSDATENGLALSRPA
jgi:hypothetical protein